MRISDWSSDVCSSDLERQGIGILVHPRAGDLAAQDAREHVAVVVGHAAPSLDRAGSLHFSAGLRLAPVVCPALGAVAATLHRTPAAAAAPALVAEQHATALGGTPPDDGEGARDVKTVGRRRSGTAAGGAKVGRYGNITVGAV